MSDSDVPLSPAAALALAARLLEAQGFTIVARNERGDSLYLARGRQGPTLRVSNHPRRPRQRQTHPEVVTSLVVATPKRSRQIEALVAAALRDFAARAPLPPDCESRPDVV
ncbi:hypothetical protein ACRAWG_19680 [Methylobacterium sp. P31]